MNSVKNINLKPLVKSRYLNYDWPGYIRELRNIVERCIILGEKFDESQSNAENLPNETKKEINYHLQNWITTGERDKLFPYIINTFLIIN